MLVPLKPLSSGKSRLRGALPGVPHKDLVLALAAATIEAALASPSVGRLIVITNVPDLPYETVPDHRGDLNGAIRDAVFDGPVAVLPADLPALRPSELTEALAWSVCRSFVPDAEGTGTVLLAAPEGRLDPHFGPGSAARHEATGAIRLNGDWPALRRDVDTEADLKAVQALGWTHAGHRLHV